MDENKIVNVKTLLYDADTDEVKRIISQTEDEEILYVYAYNIIGIMVLIFHKQF